MGLIHHKNHLGENRCGSNAAGDRSAHSICDVTCAECVREVNAAMDRQREKFSQPRAVAPSIDIATIAAMAMQGLLADNRTIEDLLKAGNNKGRLASEVVAVAACEFAEALAVEINRRMKLIAEAQR